MLSPRASFGFIKQRRADFPARFTPAVFILTIILILLFLFPYLLISTDAAWIDVHKISQSRPHTGADFSLTKDIVPKRIHSHNDYWRPIPLFSALEVGAISVESDVWVRDGDLLVGHTQFSLDKTRTFRSLYVNPILEILKKQNPGPDSGDQGRCGVFDEDCDQTLYLWIDLKTGAAETWPLVLEQLGPLRNGDWLTKFDGKRIVPGAVTVIGTGTSSYDVLIKGKPSRDYFIDAPLNSIGTHSEPMHPDGVTPLYDNTTSVYASGDLNEAIGLIWSEMDARQKEVVAQKVKNANERGIEARFWNTPGWPAFRRRGVWRVLVDSGVGLLNVDDLQDAAFGNW